MRQQLRRRHEVLRTLRQADYHLSLKRFHYKVLGRTDIPVCLRLDKGEIVASDVFILRSFHRTSDRQECLSYLKT